LLLVVEEVVDLDLDLLEQVVAVEVFGTEQDIHFPQQLIHYQLELVVMVVQEEIAHFLLELWLRQQLVDLEVLLDQGLLESIVVDIHQTVMLQQVHTYSLQVQGVLGQEMQLVVLVVLVVMVLLQMEIVALMEVLEDQENHLQILQ
jgi:hypothetical protein